MNKTVCGMMLLLFVGACGPTPEQRNYTQVSSLQRICIKKHGSPVVQNGEFIECKYPFSIHIGKPKDKE